MERQHPMTESEFNRLADAIFTRIENALDANTEDVECSFNGPVLEIEFEDGSQIIVNRHTPNQEIWVAAKSGGFHFNLQDGQWRSKRDECELFGKLSELVQLATGKPVAI